MAGYGPGRPPAPWFLRSTCCPTWRLPYWVFQTYFFWSWLRRSQRLYEKGFKLLRQFPYNEELVSDSRNEHLHFSDKAVLNKCYKIGTWCSTKVKLGSMEFSSSKESKEVNLTLVVCLVQNLFKIAFSEKWRCLFPETETKFAIIWKLLEELETSSTYSLGLP